MSKYEIPNIYYIDYAKHNDFSGNVGSVFLNGKDITENILPKNNEIRMGMSLSNRFNTDNRIVLKTIINLMLKGKCEMRTPKKYIVDVLNEQIKYKANKDLIKQAIELYKETGSNILWERGQ